MESDARGPQAMDPQRASESLRERWTRKAREVEADPTPEEQVQERAKRVQELAGQEEAGGGFRIPDEADPLVKDTMTLVDSIARNLAGAPQREGVEFTLGEDGQGSLELAARMATPGFHEMMRGTQVDPRVGIVLAAVILGVGVWQDMPRDLGTGSADAGPTPESGEKVSADEF